MGGAAAPTDFDTARIVLRSAYYILDQDVALSVSGNSFGGHFDGKNHKVTLNISATASAENNTSDYGLFGMMSPLADGVVEVKNLSVEATIDIALPSSLNYGVYAGGLAGYAQHLTVSNVNVVLKSLSAAAASEITSSNSDGQVVSLGGAFGFERILIGGTVDTTVRLQQKFPVRKIVHSWVVLQAGVKPAAV